MIFSKTILRLANTFSIIFSSCIPIGVPSVKGIAKEPNALFSSLDNLKLND